jgi:Na+-transporting NADH:ubiquinone oxidoreductase subunit NqrC
MKTWKVLFVVVLLATVCSAFIANAQAMQSQQGEETGKEKIKKENLPVAAIKTLDGADYKGWTVVQAYRVKVKDSHGKETSDIEYEVEVKKDELIQVVKFDKNGITKKT